MVRKFLFVMIICFTNVLLFAVPNEESITFSFNGSFSFKPGLNFSTFNWYMPKAPDLYWSFDSYEIPENNELYDLEKIDGGVIIHWKKTGEYTITVKVNYKNCDGGTVSPTKTGVVKIITLESILPNEPSQVKIIQDNENDDIYMVCAKSDSKIGINLRSNPVVEEAKLPTDWSVTGGEGAGKLFRQIDITSPGRQKIECYCGPVRKSLEVVITKVTFNKSKLFVPDNLDTPGYPFTATVEPSERVADFKFEIENGVTISDPVDSGSGILSFKVVSTTAGNGEFTLNAKSQTLNEVCAVLPITKVSLNNPNETKVVNGQSLNLVFTTTPNIGNSFTYDLTTAKPFVGQFTSDIKNAFISGGNREVFANLANRSKNSTDVTGELKLSVSDNQDLHWKVKFPVTVTNAPPVYDSKKEVKNAIFNSKSIDVSGYVFYVDIDDNASDYVKTSSIVTNDGFLDPNAIFNTEATISDAGVSSEGKPIIKFLLNFKSDSGESIFQQKGSQTLNFTAAFEPFGLGITLGTDFTLEVRVPISESTRATAAAILLYLHANGAIPFTDSQKDKISMVVAGFLTTNVTVVKFKPLVTFTSVSENEITIDASVEKGLPFKADKAELVVPPAPGIAVPITIWYNGIKVKEF